jgi:hypothetical protein
MNKLYDIIISLFKEYTTYNEIAEKEKERIKDIDKKIVEQVKANSEDSEFILTDTIKNLFLDKVTFLDVYAKDAQLLFYSLYVLVENYQQLEDVPILPKDIVKLCEDFEHIVPRTVMVAEKGRLEERKKGTIENIKTSISSSGAFEFHLDKVKEQFKNQAE